MSTEPTEANSDVTRNESSEDDLYRILPRFVTEKFEYLKGYFLQPIYREFKWNGKTHRLLIIPAFAEDEDGQIKNFFPGLQEKVVEAALIKLAAQDKGVRFDGAKKLAFTLTQLENQLAGDGQNLTPRQIKLALRILVCAQFTIMEGEDQLSFRLIETLASVEDDFDLHYIAYLGDLVAGEIKKHKFG